MSSKKGFTLIELLIAVVIISISMLALAMSIMTAVRTNVETDMRSAAVRVTNQTAETLLSLQWVQVGSVLHVDPELTATPHTRTESNASQDAKGFPKLGQTVRNFQVNYQIAWTVEDLTVNSKRIVITVSYMGRDGQGRTNTAVVYRQIRI